MIRRQLQWLPAVVAVLAVAPVSAQSAREVADRYTEAIGGLEAIRALGSIRKTGLYVYNGLEHTVVVLQQSGSGCREEIEGLTQWGTAVDAETTVVRGWDGSTAWMDPGDGARPMPEGEAPGFLLDAPIETSLVDFEEKGHAIEVVGATDVDGVEAVHVTVTRADGLVEQWFLDASTHLPIMRTTEVPDREYKAAMTWYFDDYREVAGVLLPFYVLIEEKLFSREYIFDAMEAGARLPEDTFAAPAGVAGS